MSLKPVLMLLVAFLPAFASATEIAITMDDFRLNDGPLMTAQQKDERILSALEKNK